jgi:cytochrome c oxidase assembly protein subunit 15
MTAYALWLVAVLHAVDALLTTKTGSARSGALLLAGAVTLQATIGILTLVNVVPLTLALLHQAMAVVVLAVAVLHAEQFATGPSPAVAAEATVLRPS